MNKIKNTFTCLILSIFLNGTLPFSFADTNCNAENSRLTQAFKKQADFCKKGNKKQSYLAVNSIDKEDIIPTLQALLEHDCIDGFRNTIGRTITDDWVLRAEIDSPYLELCPDPDGTYNSYPCALVAKALDKIENEKPSFQKNELKCFVNSEWLTDEMHQKIGLTDLDIALISDDREKIFSILDAMSHMKDNHPAKNAQLLRFMPYSSSVTQSLISSHKNYSKHIISSNIKDPALETVIIIPGPGGKAWSYNESIYAIGLIEKLGLNWILVGNGRGNIELEDIKKIAPLLSDLNGPLMFWINGHGTANNTGGKHKILFTNASGEMLTLDFFEILKTISGNRAIDIILDSCYSGAAYTDAIQIFPEGTRFLSTAPVDAPSTGSGKLMLNGVSHFIKHHSKFNSMFELFSLGYLHKTINVENTGQIFALVSSIDPFVLKLDLTSIDFEYILENQEKIVNYLKNYLDGKTFKAISTFFDTINAAIRQENSLVNYFKDYFDGTTFEAINSYFYPIDMQVEQSTSTIDVENLARLVQFGVAMTRNDSCILKEGVKKLHIWDKKDEFKDLNEIKKHCSKESSQSKIYDCIIKQQDLIIEKQDKQIKALNE